MSDACFDDQNITCEMLKLLIFTSSVDRYGVRISVQKNATHKTWTYPNINLVCKAFDVQPAGNHWKVLQCPQPEKWGKVSRLNKSHVLINPT